MAKLPLAPPDDLLALLTAGLAPQALAAPAAASDVAAIAERLFGSAPDAPTSAASTRDAYLSVIDSDRFRAACGRICASYSW
jgi:hypothetical protein